MNKTTALKAIPIVVLVAICLVLGCVAIAKDTDGRYEQVMADGAETEPSGTIEAEAEETEALPPNETDEVLPDPRETEPIETEPPVTEPIVVASEGLEFTSLGNGTCYVSGAGSCKDSFIILPERSPYGELVIGIGDYAFKGCKFIKCAELSDNLKFIGAYAFYGTGIVNAAIPSELEQIGDFAFCNNPYLENITVDPQNQFFCDIDGVLYNKDASRLICYPQGKEQSTFTLSTLVSEISTMAFYNCDFIKIVDYEGSVSSFLRIKIGAGNEPFENAVVTYVSSNINTNPYEK